MTMESILSEIDAEIARLTQVRKLLAGAGSGPRTAPSSKAAAATPRKGRKKRVLSPDARKRIADAQRRRWAAQRTKGKKEAA